MRSQSVGWWRADCVPRGQRTPKARTEAEWGGRGGPTLGIEMGSCLQVSQILSYHQLSYLRLIS